MVFCLVMWAWGTQSGDVPGEAAFWVLAQSLCRWDGVKGGAGAPQRSVLLAPVKCKMRKRSQCFPAFAGVAKRNQDK